MANILGKALNGTGLTRLVAIIKQALNLKADKTEVPLVVNLLDNMSCDTSIADIHAAFVAGRVVTMKWDVFTFPLVSSQDSSHAYFASTSDEQSLMVAGTNNGGSDVWTSSLNLIQERLVSGTNIKTVNNTSLLGSGDLAIDSDSLQYVGDGTAYVGEGDSLTEAIDQLSNAIDDIDTLNEIASITAAESQASGGNNTVTITETNGTTTTFNVKNGIDGQDGADGVSLGDVALVQTTGDRTDAVMSQKAVTEYGRKVTAEDLAGTSEWIRAKLTEEGWEFGKYINTSGNLENNVNCCVSPYIPVSMSEHKGSSFIFQYMYYIYSSWCACFYDSNKAYISGLYYQGSSANRRNATIGTSDSWDDVAYVRFTFGLSNLPNCYALDTTTGEYIFKGDEYLVQFAQDDRLNVSYDFLQGEVIAQELGDSEVKAVSQKVVTENILRNTHVQFYNCGYIDKTQTYQMNLTDLQYRVMNNSDIISIRLVMTEPENAYGTATLRYVHIVGDSSTSTTTGLRIEWDNSRRMACGGVNYNNANNVNKTSGGTTINPLVFTVVWDRVNGVVRYYERDSLVSTQTNEGYKKDFFITPNKTIAIYGGDTGVYLYDMQIFDYDIFVQPYAAYENSIFGAVSVYAKIDGNLLALNGEWQNITDLGYYGAATGITYSYIDQEGNPLPGYVAGSQVVMTSNSSAVAGSTTTNRGYYVGSNTIARRFDSGIKVVSGTCKISSSTKVIEKIVDVNTGDEYGTNDVLGVGEYKIIGVADGIGVWRLTYMSGDPMVVIHTYNKQKYISCIVHLKCDAFYDGYLYDEQADHFYDISRVIKANTTPFTLPRTTTNNPPNYAGQMAVPSNGNVYIGTKTYTWKQINNS